MAHLEEITVGCQLNGIAARETVTVIAVQWYGNAALEVTFKNSRGQLGSQILYRGDEATVDVLGDSLPWSFGADADKMRLVSEAYRIHLAHLFDPYRQYTPRPSSPCPTRSRRYIRRCCRACRCVTSLRTTPVPAKPS